MSFWRKKVASSQDRSHFGRSSDELFFDFRSHTCGYGFFGWLNCESPRIWTSAKNHQEMTIGTVSTHSSSFFSNLYVILLLEEFLYQLRLVVSPNIYRVLMGVLPPTCWKQNHQRLWTRIFFWKKTDPPRPPNGKGIGIVPMPKPWGSRLFGCTAKRHASPQILNNGNC